MDRLNVSYIHSIIKTIILFNLNYTKTDKMVATCFCIALLPSNSLSNKPLSMLYACNYLTVYNF